MSVVNCTVDFADDKLIEGLRQGGVQRGREDAYIREGACMYLPEDSVRKTLQRVASHSDAGSSGALDYANSLAIEYLKLYPNSPGAVPPSWEEPWIFGVPGTDGSEVFRELGFDPGVPLSRMSPGIIQRYGTRQDAAREVLGNSRLIGRTFKTPAENPESGSRILLSGWQRF